MHIFGKSGSVVSNANSGHIIIKGSEQDQWHSEIEHQADVANESQRAEMPYFDQEEGLFDIESDYDRNKRTKPLTVPALRYLCTAFEVSGVRVKFGLKDIDGQTQIVVRLTGYKHSRDIQFNPEHMPFELQAKALLQDAAEYIRNTP